MLDKRELKEMSRKDLEKLQAAVQKALSAAKARDQRQAKKAAAKAAAEFGFSLGEIAEAPSAKASSTKKKTKRAGKQARPAYANPDMSTQTWSGRGRKPNWFVAHVENGVTPDAMRVEK